MTQNINYYRTWKQRTLIFIKLLICLTFSTIEKIKSLKKEINFRQVRVFERLYQWTKRRDIHMSNSIEIHRFKRCSFEHCGTISLKINDILIHNLISYGNRYFNCNYSILTCYILNNLL